MSKIKTLTPQQKARLPIFREEWRQIGLSTEPCDPDKVISSVKNLYAVCNLKEPKVMLFSSPATCLLARQALCLLSNKFDVQLGDQLYVQLRAQLRGQLRDQLRDQLDVQLWQQLRDQLGGQLRGQLDVQLWNQLRGQLGNQLGNQLRNQLGNQLGNQLKGAFQPLWTCGNIDAYWLAFYQFGQEIGVKYHNQAHLDAYVDYAKNCGIMFAYDGFAFVSDRPRELHFNQDWVLHNENDMAIKFSDGWGVSVWNGVRVPYPWIIQKDTLDPNEVMRTENVEQRVAGCQIIGWSKMAPSLNQKIIDGNPDSDIGALIELSLEGLPEPGRFLMARCPRNGTICEGVPYVSDIDNLPIDTALAAQAWRIGDPQSEYIHPTARS